MSSKKLVMYLDDDNRERENALVSLINLEMAPKVGEEKYFRGAFEIEFLAFSSYPELECELSKRLPDLLVLDNHLGEVKENGDICGVDLVLKYKAMYPDVMLAQRTSHMHKLEVKRSIEAGCVNVFGKSYQFGMMVFACLCFQNQLNVLANLKKTSHLSNPLNIFPTPQHEVN